LFLNETRAIFRSKSFYVEAFIFYLSALGDRKVAPPSRGWNLPTR
jgi:hypothetical protein